MATKSICAVRLLCADFCLCAFVEFSFQLSISSSAFYLLGLQVFFFILNLPAIPTNFVCLFNSNCSVCISLIHTNKSISVPLPHTNSLTLCTWLFSIYLCCAVVSFSTSGRQSSLRFYLISSTYFLVCGCLFVTWADSHFCSSTDEHTIAPPAHTGFNSHNVQFYEL